jgi:DNA polymerase III epsilon subunit-like protein
MWRRLLDLLTRTRTPLVFLDFETTGLAGAPPVEYAALVWAPWMAEETDDLSTRARLAAPPGLWQASTSRLNPGRPSDPEDLRTHGITDAEAKRAPRYDAPAQVQFWRDLAAGNGEPGDPEAERPAIFAGHNVAEADLAWMRAWGYLPEGYEPPLIDTMRLQRRLAHRDGNPFPAVPDAASLKDGPWQRDHAPRVHCPVVSHGLRPYATNLEGLTTALYGDPAPGGHGALIDTTTSALCLWAMLELWEPIFPMACTIEDPHAALAKMLAVLNAPQHGALSHDGWLSQDLQGVIRWRRGKHKGQRHNFDRSYNKWVNSLPRVPTGLDGADGYWCATETAALIMNESQARLAV